jgi:hypothetical protein
MPESDLGWLWQPLSVKTPPEGEAHQEEEEEEEEDHLVHLGKDLRSLPIISYRSQ